MKRKTKSEQPFLPGLTLRRLKTVHGGEQATGKRKTKRPFDPKQALHVVLRSSRARGEFSMLRPKHAKAIHALLERLKKRWGVSVYRYANVGNHLHLLLRAKTRESWKGFIRELAGGIAILVTGARKGMALTRSFTPLARVKSRERSSQSQSSRPDKRAFWDHLVFTRIVAFGRDFTQVAQYVATSLWEGAGVPVRKLLLSPAALRFNPLSTRVKSLQSHS